MTDRDRSSPASPRRPRLARSVAIALAGLVGCAAGATFVTGCGDSSSAGPPFPEFEGRWVVDNDTSSITCPQMEIGMQPISPWSTPPVAPGVPLGAVTLEAGVVTDLVETSSECQFGYLVHGTWATVSGADPKAAPPDCVMALGGDGSSMVLSPSSTQPVTFQLAAPVKGMAPVAFITGAAGATVNLADGNGGVTKFSGCTFAAQVRLHKITKP